MAKTILCDFDGVIHSYKSGWQGATNIPDPPVDGAIKWIENFIMFYCTIPESIAAMNTPGEFEFAIYSSRSQSFGGIFTMKRWLVKHGLDSRFLEVIKFPKQKPAAFLTIDDRAICFKGKFPSYEEIINFKPWMQRNPGQSNDGLIAELRNLVKHCSIHSGYNNCGRQQMTSRQKALYDLIVYQDDQLEFDRGQHSIIQ